MVADELARPVHWPRFIKDFYARLAAILLGFITFRTTPHRYTFGRPATRRDPGTPDRATVRADFTHPDRTSAVLFHLIQLPIVGARPTWFTDRIEPLDTS